MKLRRIFLQTFTSLGSNKLRTGLTILGIVIGVAAVIAMLSIGQGAQNSITSSINSIGSNILFLSAGANARFIGGGGGNFNRNVKALTMSDAQALMDPSQAPAVQSVAPVIQGNIAVSANGQKTNTQVLGVTSIYATIRNETTAEGSFFNDQQVNAHARVVLIGPDLATTLFGRTTGL